MAPDPSPCPFCARAAAGELVAGNRLACAFPDAFPVNPGHTLIVPRRHVAGYFDLAPEEQAALWELLPIVKAALEREHTPAGWNVGFNAGPAAGQTVFHAHVHVIPRYPGDVDDPRGGIRWVIRARAPYWKE